MGGLGDITRIYGGTGLMVAWYWLIVVFFFGFVGGMFLTALMKANDPYQEDVEINPPWIERPDDGRVIIKNEHGEMIKYDIYGVAIYDPETGKWTSLN